MSVVQVDIINDLKQKIELLAERLELHKSTNSQLVDQNTNLESRIRKQEEEIKELKKQNNTLKLSKAFVDENNGSPQEAKLQISRIVREIDKCIALLNR